MWEVGFSLYPRTAWGYALSLLPPAALFQRPNWPTTEVSVVSGLQSHPEREVG